LINFATRLANETLQLKQKRYLNLSNSIIKKEVKMIIVPIKEGENIDRVLKKLKRKFEKTGILKELRERQKFTKPSVVKREQRLKAIYIQQLQDQSEA
jgi:small subunit ribosomal protein S21